MKRFWRTVAGKTTLFIALNLEALALMACIFGAIILYLAHEVVNDFYKEMYGAVANSVGYGVYPIGAVAALCMIITFIALMTLSGKSPDSEEYVPGPLFTVPYDVLVFAVISVMAIYASLVNEFFYYPEYVIGALIGVIFYMNILVGLAMSTASRIKQKCLWKNTLVYKCLVLCHKILRWFGRSLKRMWRKLMDLFGDIPMVWRTGVMLGVLAFVELLLFSVNAYQYDNLVRLFLLRWFITVPLVLYLAIILRKLLRYGEKMAEGDLSYQIPTEGLYWEFRKHAEHLNSISQGMAQAVEERLKSERMKTELITNVSHDIKTPLTSIINYATLIGQMESEDVAIQEYSKVLVRQSEKLKRLIEDLVEASKASTGNLEVNLMSCDAGVFVSQASGEYDEKIKNAELTLITKLPDKEVRIMADSRRMWRVFDNLMNNVCKYSQVGTRVYLNLEVVGRNAVFTFRNTSKDPLNISTDELMERFVRGDSSRNTEGNGLGLSIARSLTELQGGTFELFVDGDLFKVVLQFPTN